jgi:hypothetical protein
MHFLQSSSDEVFREKFNVTPSVHWQPYVIEKDDKTLFINCIGGKRCTKVDWYVTPSKVSGTDILASIGTDEDAFYRELSFLTEDILNNH